jgi:hypothetical protein
VRFTDDGYRHDAAARDPPGIAEEDRGTSISRWARRSKIGARRKRPSQAMLRATLRRRRIPYRADETERRWTP